MPKISVIVPVYNVENYLRACIDSILNQSFTDFEIILVDDGSPDNCGEICDEYAKKDNRIYVIHQENGGLSAARNAGIDWAFANSNSEWVTFIDSDDYVHKQYLELLYNNAVKNGVNLCSCGFKHVREYICDSSIINPDICIGTTEELLKSINSYYLYNNSTACARIYKKELWNNIRFPIGKLHEDEFTIYKILFSCKKIVVIKEFLYYYFQNTSSIMHSRLTSKRLNDKLDALLQKSIFYYNNKAISLFHSSFCYYCRKVEELMHKYKHDKALKKVLQGHKKNIRTCLKNYKGHLPDEIKMFGYKKWAREPYLKQYKADLHNVKNSKGFIFTVFWAVKNYWKI